MANDIKQNKKDTKSSSTFVFWVIGLIAVCLLALIFFGNPAKKQNDPKSNNIAIDYTNQPFLGEASAPVSIIEFGDYKCPNCKDFSEQVVPMIQKELLDTGKAKLYFMNDSFINVDSIRSAKFAESVFQELGNKTFWKFHDLLFSKQPKEPEKEKMDVFTEGFLINTLKEIASASDVDKVVNNFQAKKSDDAWKSDMNNAEKLGVTGTPTIFVNGELFEGQSLDDLTKMVEKAAKGKKNE